MIKFKSIRENITEALKNPYKGKPERDLKRKLASFETQLADLIKKSRFRQRKDIEDEIRDMETKVQQVRAALKEDVNEAFSTFAVPIPSQTLNGKKIGGGKTPIIVKARTAREAIQKAAKQLGVDFKFLKTGKVVKEGLEESIDEAAKKVIATIELWNGKKMKKSFKNQSAAEAFIKKMQDEEDVRGYNMYAEGLDEAGPTYIDGVKYQKEKKKKGFNKDDWEWNSSKQLYKKVKEDVQEAAELDENQVMSAQFKVGDMPNSDLHASIEKLKTAKKKADAQKPKVSDPVLVKSLNDVISEIDKTIKDAEKAQATASKAIAKVAPSIKRTFELINRKKYLVASTGNQLDES